LNGNKKKNCLFICTVSPLNATVKSGGVSLARANFETLQTFYNVNVIDTLPQFKYSTIKKLSLILRFFLSFFNYMAGDSPWFRKRLKKLFRNNSFDLVFIDHSQIGSLSQFVKKYSSHSKVILAFQNIEFDYFSNSIHLPLGLNKILKRAAFLNEKIGLECSDSTIALTNNDSNRLYELYNRRSSFIVPISLPYKIENSNVRLNNDHSPYILFCGSFFDPNINGILWFIEKVLPQIKFKLVVIGYQMERIKNLQLYQRLMQKMDSNLISILGTVSDTSAYYKNASLVINPVYQGAGMNTKSVEALAHGKTLITTDFAVRGFPNPKPKSIFICNSEDEFIKIINLQFHEFQSNDVTLNLRNEESFQYFQKHFTIQSRINIFSNILESLL
jgi:hypothetical protein